MGLYFSWLGLSLNGKEVKKKRENLDSPAISEIADKYYKTKGMEAERKENYERQQRIQIEANIKSMMNSYIKMRKEYDKIFKKNKNDPRLGHLVKQMAELKEAIDKLRRQK